MKITIPKKEYRTILVTGGAGFMGSNMIHYLLRKYSDINIINLDKLTYAGNKENLKDIERDTRYYFVKGDIANKKIVEKVMAKVDVVINYAAETHVDRSIIDPKSFIITDVLGTYTLLEAAKKFKIKRFIQISTDEVFGSIAKGLFTEKSPFLPNSPYAASKAGADHLCRAYVKTYKTPVIVTHSCNYFGPFQYPEKLIPLAITNLFEKKKVPLYGDGTQVREWICAEDHCNAIDIILRKGRHGEIYNIGTGFRKKNIEIINTILNIMGKGKEEIHFVKDRLGHDVRYAVNTKKLRTLGWKPKNNFKKDIKTTITWYQEHLSWWRKLKNNKFTNK